MTRLGRDAPLAPTMQGRWVEADDVRAELIVEGGKITCFGHVVAYDYKQVEEIDGALVVSLRIDNEADEDTFQRANITGLALPPDGALHAYNVKFAAEFVRASR